MMTYILNIVNDDDVGVRTIVWRDFARSARSSIVKLAMAPYIS